MKAWRMRRPSGVRIGMFCRFGSDRGEASGGGHRLVITRVDAALSSALIWAGSLSV